jgi:rare lipoprotein A
LPRGTVVRVVNVANNRSVEVRINDRGPFVAGRVIDLNRRAFAELAPPSRGVIQVRIEW